MVRNNPINGLDAYGFDLLDDASNFSSGWGDKLSFGATGRIRQWMGTDDVVNRCSGSYKVGGFIGMVHQTVLINSLSGGAAGMSIKAVEGETVAQVTVNQLAGKAAEKLAGEQLIAEGNAILGSQVGVRTSQGLRFIDHLIKTPAGEIIAVEVKSGGAVRNAGQLLKDAAMATEGGIPVGKNAIDGLNGVSRVIPTIVRQMP